MKNIRYCNVCNETRQNTKDFDYNETQKNFYKGYLAVFDYPNSDICPFCNKGNPVETCFSKEELDTIGIASNYNRQLLDAMRELKDKDIIEYELKMSQFRATAGQVEAAKSQSSVEDSKPKCPHCNSTNIRPITTGSRLLSTTLFGFASRKIGKSYECLSCKYTW